MKYTVSNAEKNEMFYKGDVINDVTPKRGPTAQVTLIKIAHVT